MNNYKEFREHMTQYYENYGRVQDSNSEERLVAHFNHLNQTHVHEFAGSTKLAEAEDERHNHRFAGVTSQLIPILGGGHKHALLTNTDFFDHLHEVGAETGPAMDVGDGKHVHFIKGITTVDDAHFHEFDFATLIQSPLLPQGC